MLVRRRGLGAVVLGSMAAFAVLTLLVALDWTPLVHLDRRLASALVTSPGSTWETFWAAVSTVGQPLVFQLLAIGAGIALMIAGHRRVGLFLALVVPGAALLNNAVKALVERARPATDGLLVEAHGSSYPSGHAIASWVAAGVVVLGVGGLRRGGRGATLVSVAMTALAVLVAASRLALGVHYPSDVLGAWLVGTAWVTGVAWLVAAPGFSRTPRR